MRWESKGEHRRHGPLGQEGWRRGKTDKKGHSLICKI